MRKLKEEQKRHVVGGFDPYGNPGNPTGRPPVDTNPGIRWPPRGWPPRGW